MKSLSFPAFFGALLGVLIVFASPVPQSAQAQSINNPIRPITTEMDRPMAQALRQWVRDRSGGDDTTPPPLDFRVPAELTFITVCNMGPGGLRCHPEMSSARCPTAVDIELPDGSRTTAPVHCTGPDANGYCDCDFNEGY